MGISMEKRLRDKKTRVIDETTPLLVIAGPMFVELLLNIFLNNIDTIMLTPLYNFS